MTERVIVFAGAGASKAVDANAYPTTVEFFERLPSEITSHPDFRLVTGFLRKSDPKRAIDIEEVLWTLQKLTEFYRSVHNESDIIGYVLASNRITKMVHESYNLGHFSQSISQRLSETEALISRVNSIVYDLYGQSPGTEQFKDNWTVLLKLLSDLELVADLFTTNYDVVIETALEARFDAREVDNILGLVGGRHKRLDVGRWQADSSVPGGLLTKLHGSLDWKLKGESIFVGDPVFTGDHTKQAIIYPGFKGSSSHMFFKPFHDYLERRLSEATAVLFIGFAFRDEYINDSIRNNLPDRATVLVLNPDKKVRFPYRRAKVQYINTFFDYESVEQIAKLLAKRGNRERAVAA